MRSFVAALKRRREEFQAALDLDYRVLFFALGVSVLTTLLFALAPALRSARADLQKSLKEHGTSTAFVTDSMRLRGALTIGQLSLTVALLTASGLLAKTLLKLDTANLGIEAGHVLQFSLSPNLSHYTPQQTASLFDRLREAIAQIPGVRWWLWRCCRFSGMWTRAPTLQPRVTQPSRARTRIASGTKWSGLLFAMGIPCFPAANSRNADTGQTRPWSSSTKSSRARFFAGRDPIGLHISIGSGRDAPQPGFEVVGVVQDTSMTTFATRFRLSCTSSIPRTRRGTP